MKKSTRYLRYLPVAIGVLLTLLIAVGVYLLRDVFQKPVQTKKTVQQVTILQPPPPPPPPPPEQKMPEPEVKEEKMEAPEPEPEPEAKQDDAEPPPGEELGVDAEGGAGSDAFGLVGKKGGRGLLGGGGGNAIIWYGGQVSKAIEKDLERLLGNTPARQASYSVMLNVWVNPDGRVRQAEMAGSSGKPEIDAEIRNALGRLSLILDRPPPEDMPQPLKIRVTSRI